MPRVRHIAYIIGRAQKPATLERVLDMEDPVATLVFCRTRLEVESLVEKCNAHGHRAEALHGGMMQKQRDRVMGLFRAQKASLLIATDVAARGLDIEHLSHVVNYDVPASPEVYLHRVGRTGRAGRGGTAITLAEPREQHHLRAIERFTKSKLEVGKVPTVADLRVRRLELMRASLRERLVAADFDDVRVVVASLAEEFDPIDIAAAAVKMAHVAMGDDATLRIRPPPRLRRFGATVRRDFAASAGQARPGQPALRSAGHASERLRRDKPGRGRRATLPRSIARQRARAGAPRGGRSQPCGGQARGQHGDGNMVRLFIGAGRALGIRPGDLVGAITGEADVRSRSLGAIEIADKFSLIEVPEALADQIIVALKATKIRGQKVTVRRERTA